MREEVGEKRIIPPRRTFWRKMYDGAGMGFSSVTSHKEVGVLNLDAVLRSQGHEKINLASRKKALCRAHNRAAPAGALRLYLCIFLVE